MSDRPSLLGMVLTSGSQLGAILLPTPTRGYLAMLGGIFSCHNFGGATGISWVEAREAAEHPTMRRAAPYR